MSEREKLAADQERIALGIEDCLFQLRDRGPDYPRYMACQLSCSEADARVIIDALRLAALQRAKEKAR